MASLVDWLCFSGAHLATGLPVASGKAYFYQPNSTSVAVDIFADPEEAQPLSQPVTLDAAGKATVYTREQAEVVIKTSTGASVTLSTNATTKNAEQVIAEWDGVDDSLDDILADIETNFGDGGQYTEGGTNTVPRTYHDVVRVGISPYDFGAVGNGSADDAIPLQRAIDRAVATDLPLLLGDGVFKTSVALSVLKPIDIRGNGPNQSKITSASEAINGLTCTLTGADMIIPFTWSDFSVVLPFTNGTGNTGVKLVGCSRAAVERVHSTATIGFHADDGTSSACAPVFRDCLATVDGVSGSIGRGFLFECAAEAHNCLTYGNYGAHGVAYSRGYDLSAPGASAYKCMAQACHYGFYPSGEATNIQNMIGCWTRSCTWGYWFETGTNVVGCSAIDSVTADYANADTGFPSQFGNSWDAPVGRKSIAFQTSATDSPTLTMDPESEVQYLYFTGVGTTGTLTLNWPAVSYKVGVEYTLIISCLNTRAFSSIVTNFLTATPPGIAAGGGVSCTFLSPDGTVFHQTPWNSLTHPTPKSYGYQTSSNASPSLVFDVTKEVNHFYLTGTGTAGTLTITWPTPEPDLPKGIEYTVVIEMELGRGFAACDILEAAVSGVDSDPETLAVGSWYSVKLMTSGAQTGARLIKTTEWCISIPPGS